jgi:hypothetical protein
VSLVLTQLAEDSFNYANVSPLPSANWTANTGSYAAQTLKVASNLCEITVISDEEGLEFFTGVSLPDDQYASATLANIATSATGSTLFLQARATPVPNEYFGNGYSCLIYNAGTGYGPYPTSNPVVILYSYTNGTPTLITIVSSFGRMAANDIWTIAVIGTTVYVLQNGVTILSVSDSSYASGTTALGEEETSENAANVHVSLFTTGSASNGLVTTSTFSPSPGIFKTTQHVELLNADSALSGFEQYYTTNGSTPTESSTEYSGAITVSEPTTIKVLAVAKG